MKLSVKKLCFIALLSVFSVWLFFATPLLEVETSLMSLIPVSDNESDVQNILVDKYSSMVNIVVETEKLDDGKREVERIYSELLSNGFDDKSIKYKLKNLALEDVVKFFETYGKNYLTIEDRNLIANSEYEKIKENIEGKLLYSWSPLLIDLGKDNFLTLNNYVSSMLTGNFNWMEKDGFIWQEKDDKNYFLLSVKVHSDMDKMISDVNLVDSIVSSSGKNAVVFAVGGPIHTVKAYDRCRLQILFVSIVSVIFVICLTYFLFKKFSIIFVIAGNLFIAFWVGCVCLFLCFNKVHFLSFAFGTTLIGICIDYSFHYFYNCGKEDIKECMKNIFFSFITTVLCFVPLVFSSVDLLRQVAVFTIGGLIATFILVLCQYYSSENCNVIVKNDDRFVCKFSLSKFVRTFLLFLCSLMIVVGAFFVKFDNVVTDFYKPDGELLQNEQSFLNLNGPAYSSFLIVQGDSLDEVFLFDEFIKDFNNYSFFSVSSIFPSKSRQFENKKLIEKIDASDVALWVRKTFNLPENFAQDYDVELSEDVVKNAFPDLFSQFVVQGSNGRVWEFIPLTQKIKIPSSLIDNAFVFDLREKMKNMFNDYSRESYVLLAISFFCLFLFLICIYKKRVFFYLLPSFISVLLTMVVLGVLGVNISFFSLLSLFIVIGLSMDYTIFHLEKGACKNIKPVFFSFLTSFVSFGLLMFVDFYLVRIMGMTIFIGLGFSYLLSLFVFGNVCGGNKRANKNSPH